jgi:uncharacterized repeat protein (TIGR04052 family)
VQLPGPRAGPSLLGMRTTAFVGLCLALVSCGDTEPVTSISFAAVVGSDTFECGSTYSGLGASGADVTIQDFRFYVHDVRLVDASGEETPFVLEDDGLWQNGEVALLDFENGCGDMGNSELRTIVEGRAPEGDYVGVRFKVGVPAELNHQNPVDAAPPLSLSDLFWTWNAGYKFIRIDARSSLADAWRVHLGSTLCTGDMMGNASCSNLNVPDVSVDLPGGFDPVTGTVVADVAGLVESSMLDNTDPTPPGCMSNPDDPDCEPIFNSLGLAFGGGTPPGSQSFFRLEP